MTETTSTETVAAANLSPTSDPIVQYIAMRSDLKWPKGKK